MKVIKRLMSNDQATIKYVWSLDDNNYIESVYLQFEEYDSLCISSQAGCNLNCKFCATGLEGLKRNLTVSEIVGQVEGVFMDVGLPTRDFEVSFMGMGEPLLNLETILEAINRLKVNYPAIRFSLSTVGIVNKLYELKHKTTDLRLQVSLHAPNDELRTQIMPITKKYPISEVLEAAVAYAHFSEKYLTINYLLLNEFNDSEACAHELVKLLQGIPKEVTTYLKLSRYNIISEFEFTCSPDEQHEAFEAICVQSGLNVYRWASKGVDIGGGCGELRSKMPHFPQSRNVVSNIRISGLK